jgi:hypothetical protein
MDARDLLSVSRHFGLVGT